MLSKHCESTDVDRRPGLQVPPGSTSSDTFKVVQYLHLCTKYDVYMLQTLSPARTRELSRECVVRIPSVS